MPLAALSISFLNWFKTCLHVSISSYDIVRCLVEVPFENSIVSALGRLRWRQRLSWPWLLLLSPLLNERSESLFCICVNDCSLTIIGTNTDGRCWTDVPCIEFVGLVNEIRDSMKNFSLHCFISNRVGFVSQFFSGT